MKLPTVDRLWAPLAALVVTCMLMGAGPNAWAQDATEEVEETAVEAVEEAADADEEAEAAAAAAEKMEEFLELRAGYGEEFIEAFDFFVVSMLWTVIAAALVLIMHLGFATLEAGLTQKKNTVNIMFKNVFIISIGILTYALVGFGTHYPEGDWMIENWLGIGGFIGDLSGDDSFGYGGVELCMTGYGDFIFQAMFAATAATIVSGSVAERVKLPAFMIFSTVLVALGYTIAGSWHWGEGWLSQLGAEVDGEFPDAFADFAGSTVVHGFGAAAALACVIILGPRLGKYGKDGSIKPILPSSLPLATIGVFLLFFGWFGFNGGSVLSADPAGLGLVFTTTALAASAGAVASMLFAWVILKKPDLSMALNGVLGGLVSITAGADAVSPLASIIMGAIGGVIVVISILFLDKIRIDDPVGAISVHGTCGIWGTLAVAFFGGASFMSQLTGVIAVYLFAFVFAFVVFYALKLIMGVRVSEEEEREGLDVAEHGVPAYND